MSKAEPSRNDAIQHTSTHLAEIIRRRYDATDEHGNPLRGLFLIDTPCGSGKTSCVPLVAAQIAKARREQEEAEASGGQTQGKKAVTHKRIVFLTPQKKNLGKIEDYVRAYRDAGIPEGPKEHEILFVPALIDMIDQCLTPELMESVPQWCATSSQFRNLVSSVEELRTFRSHDSSMSPSYSQKIRTELEDEVRLAEKAFRSYVGDKLSKRVIPSDDGGEPKTEVISKGERLERLHGDPEWMWLGKLYPTAFVDEALVIAMTVSKFGLNFHNLVEKPFCFRESSLIDDAIVIMDEFDSCKSVMLKAEVDKAVDTPVDIIDLARQIDRGMDFKTYPRRITRNSKWRNDHDLRDVKDFWARIKEVASDAMKDARLRYQYKTDKDVSHGRFLFYDYRLRVLGGGSCVVVWDRRENHNAIRLRKKGGEQGGEDPGATEVRSLSEIVGRAQGVVSFLQSYLWVLSHNYYQNKADANTDTMNCARSILHVMSLSDKQIEYVINGSRYVFRRGSRGIQPKSTAVMVGDRSIYARGFKLLSLKDSENHSASTEVLSYALQTTPERVLLDICSRALVIGMSATIGIDSALSNFDIGYIESQNPGTVMRPTVEEDTGLREAWKTMQAGYANVKYCFSRLSANASGLEGWTDVMGGDAEAAVAAYGRLRDVDEPYVRARYARFVKAFRYFLENDGIHAMLALAMPAPKAGETFDRWVIKDLCEILCRSMGMIEQIGSLKFITSSNNFNREFVGEIKPLLEGGERVFIVASYQTMSTGVNPQYVPLNGDDTIVVNPFAGDEVDFDSIYLDDLTNLAPYPRDMGFRDTLVSMYELSELYQRLQVSSGSYYRLLETFARCVYAKPKYPVSLKGCVDALRRGTFVAYQSLGRTDRTGRKFPVMHVLVSEGCAASLDAHALDGRLVNETFARFVDFLGQPPIQSDESLTSMLDLEKKSGEIRSFIRRVVHTRAWSEEDTFFWVDLRNQIMKHPTCSLSDLTPLLSNVHFKTPRHMSSYTFAEKEDFKEVEVSFDPSVLLQREVSAAAARLDILSLVPEVASFFRENEWPMEWEDGDYMLTPIMFNNFYLAMIGESVGSHLISRFDPNISLVSLMQVESFELSDYMVEGMNSYIDFKNWTVGSANDDVTEIAKVRKKADLIDPGCRAAVVNLMGSAADGYSCRRYDDGRILTVPYLIDTDTLTIDQRNLATLVNWLKEGNR